MASLLHVSVNGYSRTTFATSEEIENEPKEGPCEEPNCSPKHEHKTCDLTHLVKRFRINGPQQRENHCEHTTNDRPDDQEPPEANRTLNRNIYLLFSHHGFTHDRCGFGCLCRVVNIGCIGLHRGFGRDALVRPLPGILRSRRSRVLLIHTPILALPGSKNATLADRAASGGAITG